MASDDDAMDIDGSEDMDYLWKELYADPVLSLAPVDAFQLMEFEESRSTAASSQKGWSLSRYFSIAQDSAKQLPLSLDRMLSHQREPLLVPLLKTSASFGHEAKCVFNHLLVAAGWTPSTMNSSLNAVHEVLQFGLMSTEMRNELYMQIFKQLRHNGNDEARLKMWKVFGVISATMPPSSEYSSLFMHFLQQTRWDEDEMNEIRDLATQIWNTWKKSVRSGSRRYTPTMEEIDIQLSNLQKMTTTVCFLDGTCEDLSYGISTTVMDAMAEIASTIGLMNSYSFSLFESHESSSSEKEWDHVQLYEHSYIADILADFAAKAQSGKTFKLIFKKTMFRESDAYILESQFVNLSYLQAQYDFLMGNYPVSSDIAAKLCAFQLYSDFGSRLPQNRRTLRKAIDSFTSIDTPITTSKQEWMQRVLDSYRGLECESKEDARNGFLSLLRSLPYGMAIFFKVKRLHDPLGLLPLQLILGINKNGLHLFKCIPKEYLSSVDFRDVIHFGFCSKTVYFKMKISDKLLPFQFESHQGEEICMALKTYIREQASRIASQLDADKDDSLVSIDFGRNYDQHLKRLQQEIDAAEKKMEVLKTTQTDHVTETKDLQEQIKKTGHDIGQVEEDRHGTQQEMHKLHGAILSITADLEALRNKLKPPRQSDVDAGTNTKLLDCLLLKEKQLNNQVGEIVIQKKSVEAKISSFEQEKQAEVQQLQQNLDRFLSEQRAVLMSKEGCVFSLAEQIGGLHAMISADHGNVEKAKTTREEFLELKKMHAELLEREQSRVATIDDQRSLIESLENELNRDRMCRKKLFNKIQDMKGKIRVYARVRPPLKQELQKGQTSVLNLLDAVSLSHSWKRDSHPRQYTFDRVFCPEASQADVFEHVEDLIQSAIDGYNVCIFAYGQTGSGKTFTIYGHEDNPGLAPRGIEKLFELLSQNSKKTGFSVTCSMLELHKDSLMDLLSDKKTKLTNQRRHSELPLPSSPPPRLSSVPRISEMPRLSETRRLSRLPQHQEKLEIRRDSYAAQLVRVEGATIVDVYSADDLIATFERGQRQRHVAATQMNIESSRSHLIMSIHIEATDLQTFVRTRGKLTFVDLAGSERLKKSGSTGEQLKEAQAINKSLSALGDVISALARGDPHIPYRNHKLTTLMSDSIGGNSKTLMFVNVSPTDANLDETQNSLQYATRVRTIKNTTSKETDKEAVHLKKQVVHWRNLESLPDYQTRIRKLIEEYK